VDCCYQDKYYIILSLNVENIIIIYDDPITGGLKPSDFKPSVRDYTHAN
jgi:hypothetical protein